MASRVAIKLGELLVVLAVVSVGTFVLADLADSDVAVEILGPDRPPEDYAELERELGLDRPLLTRFGDWLGDVVRGDLGESAIPPHPTVASKIAAALPVSLELTFLSIGLSLLVAVPLALGSARRPGGAVDRALGGVTFGMLSVPNFVAGLLLILLFVRATGWLPRAEWVRPTSEEGLAGNLRHAILPVLTICVAQVAIFTRTLRSDLVATLREDFVVAAQARGTPPWRLLVVEALRPSLASLITVLGVVVGTTMGSTIVVEALFGLPGLGSVLVEAAQRGDITVLQGGVLVIAVIYVVVNMLVDVLYTVADPRVRRVVH